MKLPYSFNNKIKSQKNIKFVSVPRINVKKLIALDIEESNNNKCLKFAKVNNVSYNYPNDGTIDVVNGGDKVWRLGINAPGSKNISLVFNNYEAKEGVVLHVYNLDHSTVLGPFSVERNSESQVFAIPPIDSNSIILEFYVLQKYCGRNASLHPLLGINKILSGYRSIRSSGPCNNNVACDNVLTTGRWSNQIRSGIGLASFTSTSGFYCSGSLINNTNNDGRQLLLTANHCGGLSSSTVVFFNYQSAECDGTGNVDSNNFVVGVNSLFTSFGSDVEIGEITNPIPESYLPYYSGWTTNTNLNGGAVCIHHPSGDIKKITYSDNVPTQASYGSAQCWRITWTDGTTEPGSSGSPLYDDTTQRVIGQLYGGGAACNGNTDNDNGEPDYYGRFDISMQNSAFRNILDSTGNISNLDGYDPYACTGSLGCIDPIACNYDISATCDDGSCILPIVETHLINVGNYYYTPVTLEINVGDKVIWINDGSLHGVNGNTNSQTGNSFNNPVSFYLPPTTGDIGEYTFTIPGTYNYDCPVGNHAANGMVGSIVVNTLVTGCTDSNACNYDSSAQCDDGSCILPDGCTNSNACNYDSSAQCDDGSCILPDGCTDSNACNYDESATCDDGSCLTAYGCTDSNACNYDARATCDDESCLTAYGCTDSTACNYDSTAQCDDGSCLKYKFFITGDCSNTNYNLITAAVVAVGGIIALISSSKGKGNKKKKED